MKAARPSLDASALGMAAGLVAAALFSLCALAIALAPDWSAAVARSLFHLDVARFASISFGAFVVGLLCWFAGTWLVFTATGGLYNWIAQRRLSIGSAETVAHQIA